jgi:uncharacterized protein DUF4245
VTRCRPVDPPGISKDGVVTESPTAPPEPTETPSRTRGRETVRDMVLSLAVVLGVVAVVLLVGMGDEPTGPAVREVGYTAQLARAREVASYDVLAPVGLGSGWKATSVRGLTSDGAVTWHLGFVTPAGHYAAVEQSAGQVQPFLDEHAEGATSAGRVRMGAARWQRLEGGRPERRALVLRGDGVTTMVAGSATWSELTTLADALRGR